jgi:hypothetical protein
MTTTVALVSGTTWTPSATGNSNFYNATNVTVICWGAGSNGGAASFNCCTGETGGYGGYSGGVSQITTYNAPSSGSINIQIPAENSTSQCWFGSSATVAANSQSTSTAGAVGSTLVGGNAGGSAGASNAGAGGGGAPGLSTGGSGGGNGAGASPGAGGSAGTPSYAATAGGTYGPGGGGSGNAAGNGGGGTSYGSGGGGAGFFGGCCGHAGGLGTQGLIIVIYTPAVSNPSVGFNIPMLGMSVAGLIAGALHIIQNLRAALCY